MFCKCGCGGKTAIAKNTRRRSGHTAGLHVNFLIGHNGRKKRIEDYVIPEPNSGCHLWIGALSPTGYGRKNHFGKNRLAHRLVYEMEHGKIPSGMTVDHLCRVRSCVNTKHMEIVTLKENILRGTAPTALHFKKRFCPKCFGPYTQKKNNLGRMCVNCNRTYRMNKYAIMKTLATTGGSKLRVNDLPRSEIVRTRDGMILSVPAFFKGGSC